MTRTIDHKMATVTVTVPGTTANLGPGFDCIGAALTIYNRFGWTALPKGEPALTVEVTGKEAEQVDRTDQNLAYRAFLQVFAKLGETPPPVKLQVELGVPLARGLGSSATAIVGGLVAANALAGDRLSSDEIAQLAIDLEGHPDNVVPALIGGCRLAATGLNGEWNICEVPWNSSIVPVVAIPNFELSTEEARRVLPQSYSRADAIFNTAHLGLLLRGLETGNSSWLTSALQDRIHQPYREALIQGYSPVREAAMEAGALGMVISGAGPTLLALTTQTAAGNVQTAMAEAWKQQGVEADVRSLQLDQKGALGSIQRD